MNSTSPLGASGSTAASPTVSLVLPCFNEVDNLAEVFARIPSYVTEVVFVDGGSVDGSVEMALSLRPDIKVLGQHAPGKGLALVIGLLAATSDIVVMADTAELVTDADGWTLRSADGSRGAHSEHTIAITEDGPVILTA